MYIMANVQYVHEIYSTQNVFTLKAHNEKCLYNLRVAHVMM